MNKKGTMNEYLDLITESEEVTGEGIGKAVGAVFSPSGAKIDRQAQVDAYKQAKADGKGLFRSARAARKAGSKSGYARIKAAWNEEDETEKEVEIKESTPRYQVYITDVKGNTVGKKEWVKFDDAVADAQKIAKTIKSNETASVWDHEKETEVWNDIDGSLTEKDELTEKVNKLYKLKSLYFEAETKPYKFEEDQEEIDKIKDDIEEEIDNLEKEVEEDFGSLAGAGIGAAAGHLTGAGPAGAILGGIAGAALGKEAGKTLHGQQKHKLAMAKVKKEETEEEPSDEEQLKIANEQIEIWESVKRKFEKKLKESYMHTHELKPGMVVMHKSWSRASEPMLVVKGKDGKIYLRATEDEGLMDDTEPLDGGESEYGWYTVKD